MKVAFFNSHILWPTHYETELELIMSHQESGDEVTQLYCHADLPACDINPYMEPEACFRCISKREEGYKALTQPVQTRRFLQLTEADKRKIASVKKDFSSIADLQLLTVDNFDIGYAISSSIISQHRNPSPELNKKMVENYIIGSLGVYYSMLNYIQKEKPDRIYVFNGRLAHPKAVLRACQRMNVECAIHERGGTKERFSVFMNTSIHDLDNTRREIHKMWENTDSVEREAIADEFYTSRMGGKSTNWYSFTNEQKDELPEGFDHSKENIAIFNSSEDEFASIGSDWKNTIYENQLTGILKMIEDSEKLEGIHLYLRMHPNLRNVNNSDSERLRSLTGKNFTLILPEAPISSYNLMMRASKVLTFGSSIGVEATYFGKPSILAGMCFYRGLDVAYEPANHEAVMALLPQKLAPKEKTGALIYGLYFSRFGQLFRFYKPIDFGSGTFNGVVVAPKLNRYQRLIKRMLESKKLSEVAERYRWNFKKRVLKKYV